MAAEDPTYVLMNGEKYAITPDAHDGMNVQTLPVSPGSACVAHASFPVPGDFKLVDHALSRVARKGAIAVVRASGEEDPEVFDPEPQ